LIVGVVDIGTNSIRLLIADENGELGRWTEVTGLGVGVDSTGVLTTEAVDRSIDVFERFAGLMHRAGVVRAVAMATSASRDATNREEFFDRSEKVLGIRPQLISGHREARLSFEGAVGKMDVPDSVVVVDIGGGSTEFVTHSEDFSVAIGTVRLSERALPDRPASPTQLRAARRLVADVFSDVMLGGSGPVIGVAGTWTSIASIVRGLGEVRADSVHGLQVDIESVRALLSRLTPMTISETEDIRGLDPKRAPVMLSGAVIAVGVMDLLGVGEVLISEADSLDGAAAELLAIR
jgi:exopolyphosphatase/guanosine-5'-triphosphate,3'-diphosphate pyrophosphatase